MTLGRLIDFKISFEKELEKKLLEFDVFFQNHMWDGFSEDKGQFVTDDDFVAIQALSDKISHMILNIGCPLSVHDMLVSISQRKIKYWGGYYSNDYGKQLKTKADRARVINESRYEYRKKHNKIMVIKGHFRWDYNAYTLSRRATDLLQIYLEKHWN